MPPVLQQRLADIRRRVQQALVVYGLSWLAATVTGATLVFCVGDWLVHFDDVGVRLIFCFVVLFIAAWVVRRNLVTPLRVPFSDVDLSMRIEERYPGFNDSLASSVQFLERAGDSRVGSPALQQAVIHDALSRLSNLDTSDVLETREVRRIVIVAAIVCLTAALMAGLDPAKTGIALRRLFVPFGAPAWPRQTSLRLLSADLEPLSELPDPLHVTRGDIYKVFAENQAGRLPDKVLLEFKGEGGRTTTETMRPLTVNASDGRAREVAVGQLAALKGEIEFRAVGGDDIDMPWRRLRVIPPPIVDNLQVTLTPPPYSKQSAEKLPEGAGHLQGLVGTRVDAVGTVSKPLQGAFLRIRDQQHDVEVSTDGRRISASFLITDVGVYSWWFDLKDAEGFENPESPRYEIRGIADAEPEIRIELPASDLHVTPDVTLPVHVMARDDMGLKEIRLIYRREDADPSATTTIPLFGGQARPKEQAAGLAWNLGELSLSDGMRLVFHAEATDDFDLTDVYPEGTAPPPHIGRSVARVLTIVSKEKKTQEIAQRQAGLLDDLERAFQQQSRARDQVGELQLQAENVGKFRPEDLDALQRTEIGQRDVAGQLRHPSTGLERRARDLLAELRDNHLDDSESERRLSDIAGELDRLGDENLPIIEQELTQARKLLQAGERSRAVKPAAEPMHDSPTADRHHSENSARTDPSRSDVESPPESANESGKPRAGGSDMPQARPPQQRPIETRHDQGPETPQGAPPMDRPEASLRQVAENQDAVLDSLSEMLEELSHWRSEHDAGRELAELIRRQDEVNRQTGEMAKRTLTKPGDRLAPQEKAELAKLADRQKKQAEQLEQLESRMEEKGESSSKASSPLSASVQEALEQSREQGIAEQMREAAGQVGENRMGEAARSQEQVLEKLRSLESALRGSRDSDTETLVKKLRQAGDELDELRKREADLLQKLIEAAKQADPLQRQAELKRLQKLQDQLREDTARMARRLQRLSAPRPSASAERAADRMQQVREQIDEGDPADAAEPIQEALDDLEQAQRELARDRRRAEERLAQEQLDKIASQLAAMIAREQSVVEEMRRLDAIRQSTGKFTRGQLLALRDLTTVQRDLREDTDRLVEKLTAAEVFAQALRGAARCMQLAIDLLEARETGADAQLAADQARRRFVDLNDSLKRDPPPPQGGAEGGGEGGGPDGQNDGRQFDGIPAIAQLKMLLALQRELLERTTRLGELRKAGVALTPTQQAELEALAKEQGELADLARDLSRLAGEPDDDASEAGPGNHADDPPAKPVQPDREDSNE